jgi:hypothetical protein
MAELKTKLNDTSVDEFLKSIKTRRNVTIHLKYLH